MEGRFQNNVDEGCNLLSSRRDEENDKTKKCGLRPTK